MATPHPTVTKPIGVEAPAPGMDVELERAVQERTAELTRANEALRREIAEQTLAEPLQVRLAAIQEATSDFVGMTDRGGRVLHVNRAGRKMMRMSDAEDVTRTRIQDYHPAWAFEIISTAGVPSAIRDGVWTGHTALLSRDGREIPVSQTILTHKDANGDVEYMATVARDISETKRTEELFRLAIETAPNGILMVSRDGVIAMANARLEKLFGYRKEELIGQPVEMLLPERFRGKHPTDRTAFFAAPSARPMGSGRELHGLCKDGAEVPVEIGLQPLHTGTELFVLATIIDITERKRLEQERKDLLKEYRMMFDSVPALIWYKDRDNRILRVNRPAAESMGKSVAELEGKSTYDLYPDEAERYHRDDLEVIHSQRPKLGIIEQVVTKSGEKLWVQTDKVPYRNEQGEIKGVIVFAMDVTARQIAQEEVRTLNAELEQRVIERTAQLEAATLTLAQRASELDDTNRKLVEAERLKSEFFANVSHELRTPLTLALAPLESLLGEGFGALPDAQRNVLGTVYNNVVRLLQMVTELLDFSKVEARRIEVRREPTEMVAVTRSILADFAPTMRQKALACGFAANLPEIPVLMDRYLYERILFNLLSNAVKFTPAGGALSVSLEQEGDRLRLSVADTGIGIAASDMPNLFQKFRQLEGSATRRFEGTGLGLAIVKDFSSLLGGTATVRSQVGEGSTFQVECAAPPSANVGLAAPPRIKRPVAAGVGLESPTYVGLSSPTPAGQLPLIVIAEDNAELASYIASLLRTHCRARIARDGEEALELIHRELPELVLSDVMMPKRDGLSLCRELKANPKTIGVPVVLLTALTHRDALLKGWEAGADEYLFKPFHPIELVTRVKSLLTTVHNRKEADKALVESEGKWREAAAKLASSNQELELFATVASHDLQEPLRMVSSYVELLAHRYAGQLDDKADRWIRFAVDGAHRMKQLILDLLDYSRVGTRGKPFEPTDCLRVFKAAENNLQKAIQECEGLVTHGALPTVRADATQLTQVFQNLIGNALKYRGGQRPEIRVEAKRENDDWLFSVRDNGIGIDPQFAERIFLVFQRLHTREEYPGTGIGLAVCKKIVERHGGRIWVESQLGQGSTFCFTIPDQKGALPVIGA